jgi:hypothetical protein
MSFNIRQQRGNAAGAARLLFCRSRFFRFPVRYHAVGLGIVKPLR